MCLFTVKEKAERAYPSSAGFIEGILGDLDTAEEMLKSEPPETRGDPIPDGGREIPPLALEKLKQLQETDREVASVISEQTGEDIETFSDIYETEHSRNTSFS